VIGLSKTGVVRLPKSLLEEIKRIKSKSVKECNKKIKAVVKKHYAKQKR
jgi:hypothetical protein